MKYYFVGEGRLEFAVHTCVRIETRGPFVERVEGSKNQLEDGTRHPLMSWQIIDFMIMLKVGKGVLCLPIYRSD